MLKNDISQIYHKKKQSRDVKNDRVSGCWNRSHRSCWPIARERLRFPWLEQQWIVQSMPSTYRNDMSDMLLQRIQFFLVTG